MTLRFRPAGPEDVGVVVEIVQSAYRGDASRAGWTTEADLIDGQRVDVAMVAELLGDGEAVVLLAELDLTPVACCELRHVAGAAVATLGMFAVRPTEQGAGLGRAVLAEAESLVRTRWGVGRLRLSVIDVRRDLIDWYLRRGFHPTGATAPFPYGDERFGRPRRDDLRFAVLEKELVAPRAGSAPLAEG